MPTKGYDTFFTEPFEKPGLTCKVCGASCESQRHTQGPTSFNEAACKVERPHDAYVCPHSGKPWHNDAHKLAIAIDQSPSRSLRGVMKRDLEQILTANRPEIEAKGN